MDDFAKLPNQERRLEQARMQPMFFREPPTFEQILNALPDLESQINARKK